MRVTKVAAAEALMVLAPGGAVASTAPGARDQTFSGDGVATVGFPDNPITNALAVGVRDDTIVAAGYRVIRGEHPTYGAVVRLRQ